MDNIIRIGAKAELDKSDEFILYPNQTCTFGGRSGKKFTIKNKGDRKYTIVNGTGTKITNFTTITNYLTDDYDVIEGEKVRCDWQIVSVPMNSFKIFTERGYYKSNR